MQGRPPKTTDQLRLNGTMKRDPARYANRKEDVKPSQSLGYAPAHLDENLKPIWNEIRSHQLPDTLGNSDRLLVEITCRLVYRMRVGVITGAERGQLISCLAQMGMTPCHRTQVSANSALAKKAIPDSPFASFTKVA